MASKKYVIYINTDFAQGDTVYHKCDKDKENPLIVTGFAIGYVKQETLEALEYTVQCCGANGGIFYFKPYELKEPVEVEQ